MITQKKIEEEARRAAATYHTNSDEPPQTTLRNMFIIGARYAQQLLWHRPTERPRRFSHPDDTTQLLMLHANTPSEVKTYTRQEISRIFLRDNFLNHDPECIAWAYIRDLKP